MGSSWIRDRTLVSFLGGWILYQPGTQFSNYWFRIHLEVSGVSGQDRTASSVSLLFSQRILEVQMAVSGKWLLENACVGKICIRIAVKWDPFIHPPKPWVPDLLFLEQLS